MSVGGKATQHLMCVNTLDMPIHVVVDLAAVPELAGSKYTSQVQA